MSTEFLQLLLWLIVLSIGIYIVYSGWFYDIHVMIDKPQLDGKIKFAYKFARGPYKNVCKIFKEVRQVAPNAKCIGIYYDDPRVVPADQLRYAAGVITEVNEVSEIGKDEMNNLKSHGYTYHQLPEIEKAITTDFKHSTFLSLILATYRVYKYINAFKQEHNVEGYPAVEMYYDEKIHYFMPMSEHDRFYVWEAEKKTN